MAGSNFHRLRFVGGQCIKTSRYSDEVQVFDCTPKHAVAEAENLTNKTIIQKETKRIANYLKG